MGDNETSCQNFNDKEANHDNYSQDNDSSCIEEVKQQQNTVIIK